ncbi:hypothetical protein EI94DRAFT_1745952, partial [Lactarius quietus]
KPPSTPTYGTPVITVHALTIGLNAVTVGRYSIADAACFYDWIISLDQEVTYIYPAPWNLVKCAYLFCRYYPLAIAPFQIWGFIGDHEYHVCEAYYPALYASTVPTILSAQFILMLRTYAFSGRKKWVLAVLSITLFGLFGVIIWVMSRELTLSLLYILVKRTGCFAISDQPTVSADGTSIAQAPFGYHLGVLTTFFDCLNMFIVVRRCIRERVTLGPLGQSFLKQGILVYVIMTILNILTIGTFFSSEVMRNVKAVGPWFAYILPSALVISFLSSATSASLIIVAPPSSRVGSSPTETELRIEYSHMINEAVEMISVGWHTQETSESFIPSISTDAQAQP